ncbi:TetR/AcrR family transcriptional regulator [Dactylosporangium sp. AC04546]|uniref:TetR/AcrR family transcriptional regulator n=1 Tax=Dactylosporangium sp. AC04546 TaxID=2862460 RepID=UPI001EE06929|nr:TetR/AcrR family transcriptional regulator C-terminal domain-containing protein [Dactylosporangium sp. AC04546]WVK88221.1 TetR/AcrR family transcriptional regulator [Dactylosporangium sp. AC04546]
MSKPVIWARLSATARTRPRGLDLTAITRAAIAIADEEGLDAVSMRKIANRIDSGTMSLYRHVNGKEDLVELMYDSVLGELLHDLDLSPAGDWRADLARLARANRALHHRHPWVGDLGSRPSLGPNALRVMEVAMACVDGQGLTIDQMMDRVSTTLQFTQGFVRAELAESEAQRRTGLDEAAWRETIAPYLAQVLLEGRHPYMARIIEEADDHPNPDEVFDRRLAMVLDGLESALPTT